MNASKVDVRERRKKKKWIRNPLEAIEDKWRVNQVYARFIFFLKL